MKLYVSIAAGKISHETTILVGDGSQTFKWLALVAAQRLSDEAKRTLHLPLTGRRKIIPLPARANLLPKDVHTAQRPFLHPDDIINEYLSDGDTVNVDLYMPVELDAFGCTSLSKWAFIAFKHHERHQQKRQSKKNTAWSSFFSSLV